MVDREQMEKERAALKQLVTCARADCGMCSLVPEPEKYQECLQVIDTCDTILREALGLPDETDAALKQREMEDEEASDGTETE